MSSEVARVLRDAADLIEPPGRWTKGAFARNAQGDPVESYSPEAVCWCADGALRKVGGTGQLNSQAWARLYRYINWTGVAVWNDAQPDAAPVVAALRAAAFEAERTDV